MLDSGVAHSSMSTRPTMSSILRKPSCAMICRTCSAMKKKKLITCSGWPGELGAQHRILRGDARPGRYSDGTCAS